MVAMTTYSLKPYNPKLALVRHHLKFIQHLLFTHTHTHRQTTDAHRKGRREERARERTDRQIGRTRHGGDAE